MIIQYKAADGLPYRLMPLVKHEKQTEGAQGEDGDPQEIHDQSQPQNTDLVQYGRTSRRADAPCHELNSRRNSHSARKPPAKITTV